MSITKYDDWKLQCGHEDEVVLTECIYCTGEILEGETVMKVPDGFLHEGCVHDWTLEWVVESTIHGITKDDL